MTWLRRRDGGLVALRRAGRTAIAMPAMFALGDVVIGNTTTAAFAAFGSFASLLLFDPPGPRRARLRAQLALALAGAILVCVGTLAEQTAATAAVATAIVAFAILFSGVVSSLLAGATTSLLLAFILSVCLPGPVSSIPDRLAGWGLASAAALLAVALLWPAPARDPLRSAAIAACRALGARLRAEVKRTVEGAQRPADAGYRAAIAEADDRVASLHDVFYATPYRPTGLSTAARTVVRLVDELQWMEGVLADAAPDPGVRHDRSVCDVKLAAAVVLERGAALLDAPSRSPAELRAALDALDEQVSALELDARLKLPSRAAAGDVAVADSTGSVLSAIDPSFRAQELSFVVAAIGRNIDLAAAAERRSWLAQLLGRAPADVRGTLASAQERAGAHVERHSLWLQNSIRGAAALGIAVLIADLSGVSHSFWVVLGTLSVLRSNALSTGQDVVRALLGTAIGFVAGAAIVAAVGTDTTVLWILLPFVVLLAGLAPATVSFAAGQAAFTLTVLIVFNILAPEGWQIGLVRIEDVALGCAVSVAVGLLFWPRGAAAALSTVLAEAYRDSARYLAEAVRFGLGRCDAGTAEQPLPAAAALRAAAASRRLDDAFRTYLAERGPKPVPLAEVTSLLAGVIGLRLAGDAVLDVWSGDGVAGGERAAARRELVAAASEMTGWYEAFAAGLADRGALPEPRPDDPAASERLVAAVGEDLQGADADASATAVRVLWTGDHLDAARRLQEMIAGPARAAASSGVT
jgi:uncharacterized membrane protein YccC